MVLPPAGDSGNSQPAVEDAGGADDFKLKVDVQLVMVDATVRDRSGRPMETLRREDFRVFENGLSKPFNRFREMSILSRSLWWSIAVGA